MGLWSKPVNNFTEGNVWVFFSATEESKEADAFGNFLIERKEVVQVRNKKCATPEGP